MSYDINLNEKLSLQPSALYKTLNGDQNQLDLNGQITYNSEGDIDPETGTRVQAKYHFNSATFPYGFVTPDARWDNFWRDGINKLLLGWDTNNEGLPSGGDGAKSMGRELANSDAFAQCHVIHAFKSTCLREPQDQADIDEVNRIKGILKSNSYNMKRVFAETAAYCAGS